MHSQIPGTPFISGGQKTVHTKGQVASRVVEVVKEFLVRVSTDCIPQLPYAKFTMILQRYLDDKGAALAAPGLWPITEDNLFLVDVEQKSQGSFQPTLALLAPS